ncbi:MAG: hypothetical protein ABJH68_09700 [Ilumatobacter sp.]|uniref:hypothetical protein n=1 Tax=Ilumatobacter sp. TaxID=1967498 RepID=UPI0032971C7E
MDDSPAPDLEPTEVVVERERRRRRDIGSTFVEIVVTITLLGIVVVPVMRSVILSITASSVAKQASEVETALLNAVDRVNRAPFTRCDYTEFARAAVLTQGWSADEVSVEQSYLDVGTDLFVPGTAGPACPNGGHRRDLIQQVAITVTSPNGDVTRTIEVVKSEI